jgi:hypothetical protein
MFREEIYLQNDFIVVDVLGGTEYQKKEKQRRVLCAEM